MIDISNIVLRVVKEAVMGMFPDCYFTTSNPDSVSKNRVVSIVDSNNSTYEKSLDFENKEHHANASFQIDVYSNNTEGKREEAKAIQALVDDAMLGMSFKRTFCNPTPNIDRSYYRITSRYEAVVSEGYDDGEGNTVHDIYRR